MAKFPEGLHALLKRQLKRNRLIDLEINANLEESWEEFLLSVSKTYANLEEDLYLLERSMTLSSNEMKTLTDKLEAIQTFACLGSLQLLKNGETLICSSEAYELTGFDPLKGAPTWTNFLDQVHEEDLEKLKILVEDCFITNEEFSTEIRFFNKSSAEQTWLFFKARIESSLINNEQQSVLAAIMFDITARKQNEENLIKANQKMLSMSRQPGMAEIATYILHNIGNILNSANVSMNVIRENLSQPYFSKLIAILKMLEDNHEDIVEYLTSDPKGKLIPEFLIKLNLRLQQQHDEFSSEINNISQSLNHINEIVAMQKTVSGSSGAIERVNLAKLIDYALHMTNKSIKGLMPIKIDTSYDEVPLIYANKSKILQILINLIKNAKDSVMEYEDCLEGHIILNLIDKDQWIDIEVIDNGMGIDSANTKKMFTFGFTTKKQGHGFGLHGSALLAKEVGGELKAESKGVGEGAKFTLTLKKNTAHGGNS